MGEMASAAATGGEIVAFVASPSSAPTGAAARPHPTYKEMVAQALTELGGSSHPAIAKYLADRFSGLPARHDALLAAHLRLLTSQSFLVMAGDSYYLPSSAPQQYLPTNPPGEKRGPGRPRKNAIPVPGYYAQLGVKRGPGRPPKGILALPPSGMKRGPGRPPKNTLALPPPSGMKRGPGRPPKNTLALPPPLGVKRGPGRPPKNILALPPPSGVKRGPGRPPKNIIGLPPPPSGIKRGPGRPPKNIIGLPPPSGIKRGPGRPPKNIIGLPPPPSGIKRGPGRPPKNIHAQSPPSGMKRGPGRPPKSIHAQSPPSEGKRARGRPPKNALALALPLPYGVKLGRGRPRKNAVLGVKRGGRLPKIAASLAAMPNGKRKPGRPRKSAATMSSSEDATVGGAHSGIAAPAMPLLLLLGPGKRKRGRPRKDKPSQPPESGDAARMEKALTVVPSDAVERIQFESGPVQIGGEARSLQSGGSSLMGKRGRGRPRKEKPLETRATALVGSSERGRPMKEKPAAATSAQTGDATSIGNKRKRGRPRKEKPAAATPAESGDAALMEKALAGVPSEALEMIQLEAGRVQNGVEARFLQSGGSSLTKRGCGRPRKEKPSETRAAEFVGKSEREKTRKEKPAASSAERPMEEKPAAPTFVGRPIKEKPSAETPDVSADAALMEKTLAIVPWEALDMIQLETGPVQNGGEARCLQSEGSSLTEKRARGRPRKEKPSETRAVALVGKNERGRPEEKPATAISAGMPMKEKQAAATSAESGDAASMSNKRKPGRPRKEKPASTTSAERPMKEKPAAASAETVDAASMGNKRKPGRPRKEKSGDNASMGNKRGRGRPRKEQLFESVFTEGALQSNLGSADLF